MSTKTRRGGGVRQMSTPVNKGEGGGKNTKNPVNVVYEQPLREIGYLTDSKKVTISSIP